MTSSNLVKDYAKRIVSVRPYNRYPDISDRKAWEGLDDELKKTLIYEGVQSRKQPWSQLLISDFTEFSRTGNRVQFEDKYFQRRRKLNSLVMAECVENKGRFLKDILDGLYLILEETTWCLPPHNSYERDAKQETMPDVTRPIIDLFDAESAAEVAFCEYLLRPVFAKESPFISTYVNERLWDRIFLPYENRHFWWMGNGEELMCNWTPWCTQNVLISALTRPEGFFTEKELHEFVEKAAASCDYFLDEYGEDGGCNEGAQYYSHAALCLFGCLELIDGAADSPEFARVYSETKIRNIANFIVKMHVSGDYYVNFADCSPLAGKRSAREFLFGKAVRDAALSEFAAKDYRSADTKGRLLSEEINLFYHVMQAFAAKDMLECEDSGAAAEDSYFDSMGLMVARDSVYTLAAKAGDNGDSHNHNDVGSFTLYKNGEPFIIDLGVGTYTRKTFSKERYELWTMQSQFHNVPTFAISDIWDILGKDPAKDANNPDIILQKDGKEYGASRVNCILNRNDGALDGKAVSSLSMDMSGAYALPESEALKDFSYLRTISLIKGQGVIVKDEYTGHLPVYMSFMTYEKPKIIEACAGVTRIKVGDIGSIEISGCTEKTMVMAFAITDQRLAAAWKHSVYRILTELDKDAQKYEFKLL